MILRTAPVAQEILTGGARRSALSTPAAEAHRKKVVISQDALRATLGQRKIPTTGSVQNIAECGICDRAARRIAELRALRRSPGWSGFRQSSAR